MYLIVGLGNPTAKYEKTRHNAGFDVIDAIADKYGIELNLRKGKAFCRNRLYRRAESDAGKTADVYEPQW